MCDDSYDDMVEFGPSISLDAMIDILARELGDTVTMGDEPWSEEVGEATTSTFGESYTLEESPAIFELPADRVIKFDKKITKFYKGVRSCTAKRGRKIRNGELAKWAKQVRKEQAAEGNRYVQSGYIHYRHDEKSGRHVDQSRWCRGWVEFTAYAVFVVKV